MRREGKLYTEIGEYFGITRQRVEQVVRMMADSYGMDVDTTDTLPYWTTRDVQQILGCDYVTVYKHFVDAKLVEGEDYFYRTPASTARRYTYSGVRKLEQHCTHKCQVCEREYRSHKRITNICTDPKCRKLFNYGHQIHEKLRGISAKIAIAVEQVEGKEWVTIYKAIKGTGLTQMQVHWLVINGVLPTRPHPYKTWRGDPVKLVSVEHIRLAENIYREHGRIR